MRPTALRLSLLLLLGLSLSDQPAAQTPPCPETTNTGSNLMRLPANDGLLGGPMPLIIRGDLAYDETSTVWIEIDSGAPEKGLCSGVLVGRNRVLTAAHCTCPRCKLQVGFGPGPKVPRVGKVLVDVSSVRLHPSHRKNGAAVQPGQDLAIFELENHEICEAYRKPATLITAGEIARADLMDFRVVGYGRTERFKAGQKLKAPVRLASFTCAQPWAEDARCVPFEEFVLTGVFERVGREGADTCEGDSGGPAFSIRNGSTFLAGITSRGLRRAGGVDGRGCGLGGVYEFVGTRSVLSWLRQHIPDLRVVGR